jgi:carboxyl-terminal processing protease
MNRIVIAALLWTCAGMAQQVESFDAVWQTIADKHWHPEHLEHLPGGGSWKGIREEYRKRVELAKDQTEVRGILREMVGRIGKSHYAIAGLEMNRSQLLRQGGGTSPGFRVGLVEGKVVVTGVSTPSIGVKVGWVLDSVAGVAVAPALSEIRRLTGATLQTGLRTHQMLQSFISGSSGETLNYQFLLSPAIKKVVAIKIPEGNGSSGFGFVQGVNVEREFLKLGKDKNVGYFRLDMFLDVIRVLPQFEQAIQSCKDCKGFLIDLRGNPGGVAIMANALAGWFVAKDNIKLGTMFQRGVNLNFVVLPRMNGYDGPLAILVDSASASTSEIFAGGMQDSKRARIFGTQTAGAALPSVVESLPNGDLFQFAVANYVSESGKELEGLGVTPDVIVRHSLAALRAGRDLVIEAALDWIHESSVRTPKP